MARMWALREYDAEAGIHGADLFVEFATATLVAGTVEVPTKFANGNILYLSAFKSNNAAVNTSVAFTTDLVVTAGAVTVSGPTADVSEIRVMIVGRLDV